MEIRLTTTAKEASEWVRWARRKQHPFAMALALTRTAKEARDVERRKLKSYFNLRSKNPVSRLQSQAARKRDHPRIFALVGHRDQYMADHATGATRRPQPQAKRITIPTSRARRTATGRIRKAFRADVLLQGKGFIEKDLLLKPIGRGGRGGTRPFFLLRPTVRIDKRWPFEKGVRRTAFATYGKHFKRAYAQALEGGPIRTKGQGPTLTPGLSVDASI